MASARFKGPFETRETQMSVTNWLERNARGFPERSEEERNAIMQFSLLWSLFEARTLETSGDADSILAVSRRWANKGLLTGETFKHELAYFRKRYRADKGFTYRFNYLNLRRSDKRDLVERVLKGETADLAEVTAALLIIVYRLRNNFFHGVKWAYEIRDQLENFNHGNSVLMQAIELHESAARC
jgi:hypothetical protein